jgi:hypothetical protein
VAEGRRVSVKPEMLLGRERVKNKQYVSAR